MRQNEINIALSAKIGVKSPVMPHVCEQFDSADFSRLCKEYTAAALLRCGFDVSDTQSGEREPWLGAVQRSADAVITIGYELFGSGRSFNDVGGFKIVYSADQSGSCKALAEDIFCKLAATGRSGGILQGGFSICPAVHVALGYATEFSEAKLIYDSDFALSMGEAIAAGVCEYFDYPVKPRDDITAYPTLCLSRRGKKVKLLQHLVNAACPSSHGKNGITPPLVADGIYGAKTDAAIKTFAQNNGISATSTSPVVWRRLLFYETKKLIKGARCAEAVYLQRKLKSKLYPVDINGVADDRTIDAAAEFCLEHCGARPTEDAINPDLFALIATVGGGRPRLI